MNGFKTISGIAESEFTEKRSRFISAAAPVKTQQEADDFIKSRREAHRDARHTVYAYILRDGYQKYSDDGEPQGTGGMPALEVIRRSGLTDVAVAITRYFGGILLGAGGLTRAYARGAADAISSASVVEYEPCAIVELVCDYGQYGRIQHIYPKMGARLLDSEFGGDVTLKLLLKSADAEPFIKAITEMTAATALAEKVEDILSVFG